jgi:hypothetical protein
MKIKKLFATIMAMVMMIAMTALPVSATTFNNLTLAGNTGYTTQITSTSNYTLISVKKIADDWQTMAPFTYAEASNVTWSWPNGGASNFVTESEITETEPNSGEYYASLKVKKASSAVSGAYSVRATWLYDEILELRATMDLTLVIPGSGENATVKVFIDGTNTTMDSNSFTVTNPSVEATAGTYGYTTPVAALAKMKAIGNIADYSPANSDYINSITKTGTLTKTASGWYGWQYRVYKHVGSSYVKQPASLTLGAATYKLDAGDIVAWYFGLYDDATTEAHFNGYNFDAIFP